MSIPQITTKKMAIYDLTDPESEKIYSNIGAEAQYIDVARDNTTSKIITDITSTPTTAFYYQPLSEILKDIEDNNYKTTDEILEEINEEDCVPFGKQEENKIIKKNIKWEKIVEGVKKGLGINSTVSTQDNIFLNQSGEWVEPKDTWTQNTANSDGYVPSPDGQAHRVWQTDEHGVPGWMEAEHIPFHKALTLNANSSTVTDDDGIWEVKDSITSTPAIATTSGGILWNLKSVTTPFQMYMPDNTDKDIYKRRFINDTWSAWQTIDTNTWRPVENNLASSSTVNSLSANQGRILGNAIVNITRDGTKFTATRANNGTFNFYQQDNNTTYSAGSNITLTGTTFSLTKANVTGALGYTPPTSMRPVVNNLTSDSTTQSLSAAQGKALNAKFTNGSVTKIGTSNVGGTTQPIYLKAGVPTKCSSFVPASGGTFTGNIIMQQASLQSTKVIQAVDRIVAGGEVGTGSTMFSGSGTVRIYDDYLHYINIKTKEDLGGNKTVTFKAAGTVGWDSSSYKVKENIRNISDQEAKKLLDVNIIKFDYKKDWNNGEKNLSGVIAEEVIKIYPEVVNIFDNYNPNLPPNAETNLPPEVDYKRFVPYLIKMVQIQQKEIDELKAKINKEEK